MFSKFQNKEKKEKTEQGRTSKKNQPQETLVKNHKNHKMSLKVVPTTFSLVCFVCLKESACETRKNVFYFTSNTLLVLEIIKF